MSRYLAFDPNGWEDYQHWQAHDRNILKRVNKLIQDALRDPASGIGKPERLKYGSELPTYSRRVTAEHRLVYQLSGDYLVVIQARFHYDD
ncbi:MAG: Txe/YoeB family addiction module toxin [Propionibacteriaceae bacterium]|jgi:toxin YoeB|nr:Txe/YoeB family addiction module toxin [Propionibacteriaceae bacterium]